MGLGEAGRRPRFDIVTGVSTGALIAPFAFLGESWDGRLTEAYTGGRAATQLGLTAVSGVLGGGLLFGSSGRQDVWRFGMPGGGEIAVRVQGRFESNYGELLRDAALAGEGIAMHSLRHVADDLRAGRLEAVLPDHPIAATAISAVMPQRRLVPPRVRAFVDFLAAEFAEPALWQRGLDAVLA